MAEPIRVALIDDHTLFRRGLAELLEHSGEVKVVGTSGSPDEARRLLREQTPDVVMMDLNMPARDGISLLRDFRAEGIDIPTLILTVSNAESDLAAALRAGARGYLLKDMEADDVGDAVRRAARGETVGAPGMTAQVRSALVTAMYCNTATGALLAGLTAPFIVTRMGWQGPFLVGGVLPIVAALLLLVTPESLKFLLHRRPGHAAIARILRSLGSLHEDLRIFSDGQFRDRSINFFFDLFDEVWHGQFRLRLISLAQLPVTFDELDGHPPWITSPGDVELGDRFMEESLTAIPVAETLEPHAGGSTAGTSQKRQERESSILSSAGMMRSAGSFRSFREGRRIIRC